MKRTAASELPPPAAATTTKRARKSLASSSSTPVVTRRQTLTATAADRELAMLSASLASRRVVASCRTTLNAPPLSTSTSQSTPVSRKSQAPPARGALSRKSTVGPGPAIEKAAGTGTRSRRTTLAGPPLATTSKTVPTPKKTRRTAVVTKSAPVVTIADLVPPPSLLASNGTGGTTATANTLSDAQSAYLRAAQWLYLLASARAESDDRATSVRAEVETHIAQLESLRVAAASLQHRLAWEAAHRSSNALQAQVEALEAVAAAVQRDDFARAHGKTVLAIGQARDRVAIEYGEVPRMDVLSAAIQAHAAHLAVITDALNSDQTEECLVLSSELAHQVSSMSSARDRMLHLGQDLATLDLQLQSRTAAEQCTPSVLASALDSLHQPVSATLFSAQQ
ncbi:hypothetical protein BC828DRAFT_404450 [Blastocladiella britannica]|nr:hypothetical protein BC828DRAFT_404450 [Blastocladiella britannica]